MIQKTTENPSTHSTLRLLVAVGAGIATYAWRRKVGRSTLPAIASAIAVASSAGAAIQRFLPNAKRTDGRLAPEGK